MQSLTKLPKRIPALDAGFQPTVLWNHAFLQAVSASGQGVPLAIALERNDGWVSVFESRVFAEGHELSAANLPYVERLVKTLLWQWGGYSLTVGGPRSVGEHIRRAYAPGGIRAFDAAFMGDQVYERPFVVHISDVDHVPTAREASIPLGRHLDGCRIGFDAGASDRKVAAVVDGRELFSEEVVWNPRNQADPEYHYHHIQSALHHAAAHMPRVDAIGVSAAGIYVANRVMVASLFRGVPPDLFRSAAQDIFLRIRKDWGNIPLEVVNDGDVTALAGSMALGDGRVLGIAMGSDEAGGYVNAEGNITGWLSELAFAPIDVNPQAPVNEWSGDRGCGGEYFSQKAVVRLAPLAGIELDSSLPPAETLKAVQALMARGDQRAELIYRTIGCHLGYAIAQYADLYDLRHVLILGRVTSGPGGQLILEDALAVLKAEFPALLERITLNLPDESSRRVGQAVAAASLPVIAEAETRRHG
jgi:predicted NBD/HSP70 family sugar kinase